MMKIIVLILFLIGAGIAYAAEVGDTKTSLKNCQISTSKQQPWVVELYTSEGCSSCPPADRWLTSINKEQEVNGRWIIPLSLHVDYWDYIGWKDPFAQAQFGQRQERLVRAQGSRSVYTPQVIVNGKTVRDWRTMNFSSGDKNNLAMPINLTAELSDGRLEVKGFLDNLEEVQIYLVVVENELQNSVIAGENKGVTLKHDGVVRLWVPAAINKQKENTLFEFNETISNTWIKENIKAYVLIQDKEFNTLAAARMDACW
jgi:hypothetical protein